MELGERRETGEKEEKWRAADGKYNNNKNNNFCVLTIEDGLGHVIALSSQGSFDCRLFLLYKMGNGGHLGGSVG